MIKQGSVLPNSSWTCFRKFVTFFIPAGVFIEAITIAFLNWLGVFELNQDLRDSITASLTSFFVLLVMSHCGALPDEFLFKSLTSCS